MAEQICVSWDINLNIGGWQLRVPPGIYPPYENLHAFIHLNQEYN